MLASPNTNPDVLLVEDDPVMTKVVTQFLRTANHRVKSFKNGYDFFRYKIPRHPCCLILDIYLGTPPDGPDIYRQLLEKGGPRIPVLFLTHKATVPLAVNLVRAGALNMLSKSDVVDNPKFLTHAVAEAIQVARTWYEEDNRTASQQALLEKLTPRELETLQWVITGMLNKQIAASLNITERTVKAHRAKITEKLGLFSVAELVRFAEGCGVPPAVMPEE